MSQPSAAAPISVAEPDIGLDFILSSTGGTCARRVATRFSSAVIDGRGETPSRGSTPPASGHARPRLERTDGGGDPVGAGVYQYQLESGRHAWVHVAQGDAEAMVIKSLLESNGIEVKGAKESIGRLGAIQLNDLGEVKLYVQEKDFGEAKLLIESDVI